ncbi:hypothetical protein [Halalkalibacillus halophilus]|uniref:hypothetical protein n=1 Tax=Halalkalibacillus halophilus TaxID=392827 RepID=UPI00041A39DF|nr:hypothetical protein [Halalkalibacillus halophilus]
MNTKKKALIAGLIIVVVLLGIVFYLSYLGLRENPEEASKVKEEAEVYLNETYDQPMEIVDTLLDNTGVYDIFRYAAIVNVPDHDNYRVLVYKHNQTGEYTDSYIAEMFEYELEGLLLPELESHFGEDVIDDLWITYPKDIGDQLNLKPDDQPSLIGKDAHPVVRITLNRGHENSDEEDLDSIIKTMQEDFEIPSGNVTLTFQDSSFIFKDKNLRESFD